MASATIKLFLVHGDPKRLRTAELSNWTGKAVSGPRTAFEGVLAREESEKSGIYFLSVFAWVGLPLYSCMPQVARVLQ